MLKEQDGYRERVNDSKILSREMALRAWFTRNADPVLAEVDGLDIGWGGVQRWATGHMPAPTCGPHLDFACGYGTFLAQLGWRFPGARLTGLNIDFSGPHASIRELLAQAGVQVHLTQANACCMPFPEGTFDSASCFLGLQDIEIGFGQAGVRSALTEAVRVLRIEGALTLLDEFSFEQFDSLLSGLPIVTLNKAEHTLDVRWNRQVAKRAIDLYTEGWVGQARPASADERQHLYAETHAQLRTEMENQLSIQGYYVPFGPLRMIAVRKKR
jgi:ubiquinone/menaquinone biosynthesis C-methylase UbiE